MDSGADSTTGEALDYASSGPGTLGGQYLRQFWQPVGVSKELENGKAMPIHVLGEKFTLYRGQTGTAHVVGYRCAHRSTQLSTGWVRDDCIQCMYHGWRYDGDGNCVERPGEKNPGAFERANIPAYPTREHLGLIYAYFGEGDEAPFPPHPGYKTEHTIENHVLDFPSNWFQTMENHFDETHIAFVHSFGGSHNNLGRDVRLPDTNVYETEFGMVRETSVDGGDVRKTLYILPNIMRILIPSFAELNEVGGWRDTYIILVPTDDKNHRVYFTQNVEVPEKDMEAFHAVHERFNARVAASAPITEIAADILVGKGHISDHLDHPHLLLLEDAITQGGQGQIVDRSQEMLGRTDVGIVVWRNVFERELRAVASGKPTTDWAPMSVDPVLGF